MWKFPPLSLEDSTCSTPDRLLIAAACGVSDGTVKSQLATIFDKTGTGDQRELELLMRELSPPLLSS
jgi:hypothetical protein